MKRKILALGVLSLCCVSLFADSAHAWGLFAGWCPRNRYVTQITCRPYNAFTPICWGNLVCDGVCPSPCGVMGGQMPVNMGVPPWACNPCASGPCMGGYYGGGDASYASDMPMHGPSMPMPTGAPPSYQPMPNFNPPMPMPVGPNTTMQYPPMYQGVAQANYYPMPMPQYNPHQAAPMPYNPYMAWPNTQAVPYYWYANGR